MNVQGRFRRLYRIAPRTADEVPPRSGHVAVCVGMQVLVWGGYRDADYFDERYLPPSDLWSYSIDFQKWQCNTTKGHLPPGASGACCCVIDDALYVLFGHTIQGYSNSVHKLDLRTLSWKLVATPPDSPSPRDKLTAWTHKKKIYCFGGFGFPLTNYLSNHGDYLADKSDNHPFFMLTGWNNQLVVFDTETETWTAPKCRGAVPLPRAAHSAARLQDKVFLFGGRHMDTRMNDLHCLDLDTLTWSGELRSSTLVPCGRSWHSFTAVSQNSIFLYGGYTQDQITLSDAWLLNVDTLQWTLLNMPQTNPRLWHTTVISSHDDIVVFGGCSDNILTQEINEHSNDILVFRVQPKYLLRMCLETVFTYRMETNPSWAYLPSILRKWLETRLKCAQKPAHNRLLPDSNNEQPSTCEIS